jgi:hypothetical protein
MVPFTLPIAIEQVTLGEIQRIDYPNIVSSMPAFVGSEFRNNNALPMVVTPSNTPPDCVYPAWTDVEVRTSLLLRNLPGSFTRDKVMEVLRTLGLATKVDFLYNPWNLKIKQSCGYAFVNFTTPEAAVECLQRLHGFCLDVQGEHVCEVQWCTDNQGLHAHVERYRDSRIMHECVNDAYKPALFTNGVRVAFPRPSCVIKKPRLRNF